MYRDYLVEQKEKMKWTTEQLSARSGVPVGTINKILSGETVSPRYDTISALNQAFEESRTITSILREMSGYYVSDPISDKVCVKNDKFRATTKTPIIPQIIAINVLAINA